MKPLTIEELKALEVGDWVWVVETGHEGNYHCVESHHKMCLTTVCDRLYCYLKYSEYGTKWVAYKNKEQAEAKSEIVELPFIHQRKLDGDWEVVSVHPDGYARIEIFTNKQNAERRLAELKGEKE